MCGIQAPSAEQWRDIQRSRAPRYGTSSGNGFSQSLIDGNYDQAAGHALNISSIFAFEAFGLRSGSVNYSSGGTRQLRLPQTNYDLSGTQVLGETLPNGDVFLRPGLSRADQVATLRHEFVHAFFSPRGDGPVTRFRQDLGQFGYDNSQILRFVEEAIAVGYASRSISQGIRHPLENGYGITPLGLLGEGAVLGGFGYLGYELTIGGQDQ